MNSIFGMKFIDTSTTKNPTAATIRCNTICLFIGPPPCAHFADLQAPENTPLYRTRTRDLESNPHPCSGRRLQGKDKWRYARPSCAKHFGMNLHSINIVEEPHCLDIATTFDFHIKNTHVGCSWGQRESRCRRIDIYSPTLHRHKA